MRLFKRKPSREQVAASIVPHCITYIFGYHRGRKPAKSEMRGHLKCCLRKVLHHYGYQYDREEADIFMDFVYSEARRLEYKDKALKRARLAAGSLDSVEQVFESRCLGDFIDSKHLELGQEGFEIY